MPLRFEIVLGLFIALKKQLEDEEKERQKAEGDAGSADISGYTGQANSMIRNATANIPKVNMPSMPHV